MSDPGAASATGAGPARPARRRHRRRAAARHPAAGQRRPALGAGARPGGCCRTACATTCGLTGTHVGCEHGVCGACTVLVDGEPVRSCLMFAVTAEGHEITTVEGLGTTPSAMSPVQQAFRECHGLQCGFCTPGFLTTMTAYLDENPDPTPGGGPRGDLRQPVPLHGLPEHRQGRARAAELAEEAPAIDGMVDGMTGGGSPVSTRQFGELVQRREDPRLLTGNGRYLDDLGHTRWPPRSCAARTPTPGSSTSTSPTRSTSTASWRSTPGTTCPAGSPSRCPC